MEIAEPVNPADTTQAFVDQLVRNFRESPVIDQEILNILTENILTVEPKHTAVDDALKAVKELSTNRAEGASSDDTDNDRKSHH